MANRNRARIKDALNQYVLGPVARAVPAPIRATLALRAFGIMKIPVLFFISPSVVELTEERVVVKVPLNRRTRNHLGSMYFGVLAAGADCAGGLIAKQLIDRQGGLGKISLIFKDFHAEFLKRPEGDTLFTCVEGREIGLLVARTLESSERQNLSVHITATVPSRLGSEPVAKFTLTLSLKKRA